MEIKIRKATNQDIPALLSMAKELQKYHRNLVEKNNALKPYLQPTKNFDKVWRPWVLKNIKSSKSQVLVAELNNKIVGYSLTHIKDNAPVYAIKQLGYIDDLFVKQGYRGKGIGLSLNGAIVKWLKGKGIKHMSLGFHAYNKRTGKTYRKWGFRDFQVDARKEI